MISVSIEPVIADLAGNLVDQDNDGQGGEPADDLIAVSFEQQLPNLIVTRIVQPAEAVGGQPIEVEWTVTNQGNSVAEGAGMMSSISLRTTTREAISLSPARDLESPWPRVNRILVLS